MRSLVLLGAALAACGGAGSKPPPGDDGGEGLAHVVIDEIDCRGTEWIELLNLGPDEADLGQRALVIREGETEESVALSGRLAAGARRLVDAENDGLPAVPCSGITISLRRSGATGEEDQVSLSGALRRKATRARLPDGTGPLGEGTPTPGAPNEPRDAAGPLFDPLAPFTLDIRLPPASRAELEIDGRSYVPAEIEVTGVPGATGPRQVAIKLKGSGTFARLGEGKPSFKIDLNRLDSAGELLGLEKLTLNSEVYDPSYLREWLGYAIVRLSGAPAPRVGFARVRLDGVEIGIFANVESLDDVFTDAWFPSTAHLYESSNEGGDLVPENLVRFGVDEGDPEDLADLGALIAALPSGLEAASPLLHRKELVDLWAAEIAVGETDGSFDAKNYSLHADDDGRFSLLTGSKDLAFTHEEEPFTRAPVRMKLWSACLLDASCRAEVAARTLELLDDPGLADLLDGTAAIADALRPILREVPDQPYGEQAMDEMRAQVLAFARGPRAELRAELACQRDGAPDPDGDGYVCSMDCKEGDAAFHPGAPEICGDRQDQDCDLRLDDGCP